MRSVHTGFNAARVIIVLAALITASCGMATKEEKQHEQFVAAIDGYNAAFRWQDYKTASGFVDPANQEAFWKEADAFLKEVRIMDYEIRNVSFEANGLRGTVFINCRFYLTREPSLQSKMIRQTWQFLEKPKTWQVTNSGYQAILAQTQ
ncbi:MAG TPA: hypothetical protein PK250_10645 [Syntrophobacter fumaroxidans]|nr:hypothetical protein [Syntrophobacter fumaroxidans]